MNVKRKIIKSFLFCIGYFGLLNSHIYSQVSSDGITLESLGIETLSGFDSTVVIKKFDLVPLSGTDLAYSLVVSDQGLIKVIVKSSQSDELSTYQCFGAMSENDVTGPIISPNGQDYGFMCRNPNTSQCIVKIGYTINSYDDCGDLKHKFSYGVDRWVYSAKLNGSWQVYNRNGDTLEVFDEYGIPLEGYLREPVDLSFSEDGSKLGYSFCISGAMGFGESCYAYVSSFSSFDQLPSQSELLGPYQEITDFAFSFDEESQGWKLRYKDFYYQGEGFVIKRDSTDSPHEEIASGYTRSVLTVDQAKYNPQSYLAITRSSVGYELNSNDGYVEFVQEIPSNLRPLKGAIAENGSWNISLYSHSSAADYIVPYRNGSEVLPACNACPFYQIDDIVLSSHKDQYWGYVASGVNAGHVVQYVVVYKGDQLIQRYGPFDKVSEFQLSGNGKIWSFHYEGNGESRFKVFDDTGVAQDFADTNLSAIVLAPEPNWGASYWAYFQTNYPDTINQNRELFINGRSYGQFHDASFVKRDQKIYVSTMNGAQFSSLFDISYHKIRSPYEDVAIVGNVLESSHNLPRELPEQNILDVNLDLESLGLTMSDIKEVRLFFEKLEVQNSRGNRIYIVYAESPFGNSLSKKVLREYDFLKRGNSMIAGNSFWLSIPSTNNGSNLKIDYSLLGSTDLNTNHFGFRITKAQIWRK